MYKTGEMRKGSLYNSDRTMNMKDMKHKHLCFYIWGNERDSTVNLSCFKSVGWPHTKMTLGISYLFTLFLLKMYFPLSFI